MSCVILGPKREYGAVDMTKPRILAIAYACMPEVGSEPGTGFAWARIAAGIGETWILTRPWPERRHQLDAAVAAAPERGSMHVVYVDLPRGFGTRRWDPFRSRNQRIEYLLWQIVALRAARRIARRERIDLVWHLTYANIWMGSLGALVGPRFILGPVGGGVGTSWSLLPSLGLWGAAYETTRSIARTAGRHLNPFARVAWKRAALILVQNVETYRWLPRSARAKTEIYHNVVLGGALDQRSGAREPHDPPVAMFAGRLLPFKGAALGIKAIALLPGWRYLIAGTGADEGRLRALVRDLGLVDRVEFRGWVPREAVLSMMRDEADVFLFPSLHEEGGSVVGEALAVRLPVVCVDRGGPPAIGGMAVRVRGEAATVADLARAARAAVQRPQPLPAAPTLEERSRGVREILARHGLLGRAPTE